MDGFVSVHAGEATGALVTKPLRFAGRRLAVNFSTRVNGYVRVELQRPDGSPFDRYSAEAGEPLRGDQIKHIVHWNSRSDVSNLAGRLVRLRVVIENADLYSFQFVQ